MNDHSNEESDEGGHEESENTDDGPDRAEDVDEKDTEQTINDDKPKEVKRDKQSARADNIKQKQKPTRRPGRPRTIPIRKSTPRNGISQAPGNNNNQVELSYSGPMDLEKLWAFCKHMAIKVNQILVR